MFLARLEDADRCAAAHPGLAAAFALLRRADLAALDEGRIEIDGERLFALVARARGRGEEASPLESHRRYVDVQYVVAGSDRIGWLPTSHCRQPRGAYDAERDILFYDDRPASWFTIGPGLLAVFFPEDAHAPLAGEGPIHKVVVKLSVEWATA